MPTNMIQSRKIFTEPISLLASNDYLSYQSTGLDLDSILADTDGKKVLKAGTFLQEPFAFTPSGAPAPVSVSVVPFARNLGISGNTINFGTDAHAFLPGMVVTVPGGGFNLITLSGTVATADTVTLTLQTGLTATATAVAGETLTTLAVKLATAINNNPRMAQYVTAIAGGALIYLWYHTERTFASSVARTGTIAAPAILNADKLQDYALGTVQSVSAAGVVTLTGAPSQAFPVGFPFTRVFDPNKLLGITISEIVYQYTTQAVSDIVGEANDVAAYYEATLHRARVPFWSQYYSQFLPELKFFPN